MDVRVAIETYISNRDRFLRAADRGDELLVRIAWASAADDMHRLAGELGATDTEFAHAELDNIPEEPDNPHAALPEYASYRALDTLLDQYAAYWELGARARADRRADNERRWSEAAEACLRIAVELGADSDFLAAATDREARAEDFDGSAPRRACGCKYYDCTGRDEPAELDDM